MRKNLIIGLTLGVLISSCSKDPAAEVPAQVGETVELAKQPSLETTPLTGNWQKGYYKGDLIAYEKKNNMNLFLGDIIIRNDEISDKPQKKFDKIMGSGLPGSDFLWPKRTINYVIEPGTIDYKRQWILTAMNNWSSSAGITFSDVSRKSNKGDHLYLVYGNIGNNSYVGRITGEQRVNLESDGVGVVVHELGHAIGMYHEQTRSDRDKYIRIMWENIQESWQPQYFQYAAGEDYIVKAPREKFDFNSIMLYSPINTSAIDINLPVMTKLNGEIWNDNVYNGTDAPSFTDAKWVKFRYRHMK